MSSKELEIKLHDLKDMLRMAEELSGMIENAKDELNNGEKDSFSVGKDVFDHVTISDGKEFPFVRI